MGIVDIHTVQENVRTIQDLLSERRSNLIESMRERDPIAKAMLLAHVDSIDAEIARRSDVTQPQRGI